MCGCVAGDRMRVSIPKNTDVYGYIRHVETVRHQGNYVRQYFEIELDNGEIIEGNLDYVAGVPVADNPFSLLKINTEVGNKQLANV